MIIKLGEFATEGLADGVAGLGGQIVLFCKGNGNLFGSLSLEYHALLFPVFRHLDLELQYGSYIRVVINWGTNFFRGRPVCSAAWCLGSVWSILLILPRAIGIGTRSRPAPSLSSPPASLPVPRIGAPCVPGPCAGPRSRRPSAPAAAACTPLGPASVFPSPEFRPASYRKLAQTAELRAAIRRLWSHPRYLARPSRHLVQLVAFALSTSTPPYANREYGRLEWPEEQTPEGRILGRKVHSLVLVASTLSLYSRNFSCRSFHIVSIMSSTVFPPRALIFRFAMILLEFLSTAGMCENVGPDGRVLRCAMRLR